MRVVVFHTVLPPCEIWSVSTTKLYSPSVYPSPSTGFFTLHATYCPPPAINEGQHNTRTSTASSIISQREHLAPPVAVGSLTPDPNPNRSAALC